jgi:hypothetical protein
MKFIRETLYEGFVRSGSDKLSSLGIGKIQLIKEWVEKIDLKNYTINDDYTIDVIGTINLYQKIIPEYIHFGIVKGYFNCSETGIKTLNGLIKQCWSFSCIGNELKSLEGGPTSVRGVYNCSENLLTSLKGVSKDVTSLFCDHNNLRDLEYCPMNKDGMLISLFCQNNLLTSLKGSPKIIEGDFSIQDNLLKSLKYAPKSVSGDIWLGTNNLSASEIKFYKNSIVLGGKIYSKNQSK